MNVTPALVLLLGQQGLLDRAVDRSVEGHRMDWLMDFSTTWIFVLFGLMATWLFTAVYLHRDKKHTAQYITGDGPRGWWVGVGIASFVFLVVDGTLFTKSFADVEHTYWNFAGVEEDPRTLRIEINARQWLWEARYAGTDGEFDTGDDVARMHEIYVPVGRPVLMQIGASDVLHNLYIPQLRIKQDAVPGSITQAWFAAKETGRYEIACAQHCGVNHYKMRGMMVVVTEEEFDRWLALAQRDSDALYDPEDHEGHWGWPWMKR